MATTMIQTSDVTWKMADGWPVPGETLSVTLAKEIGLALDDPDHLNSITALCNKACNAIRLHTSHFRTIVGG